MGTDPRVGQCCVSPLSGGRCTRQAPWRSQVEHFVCYTHWGNKVRGHTTYWWEGNREHSDQ